MPEFILARTDEPPALINGQLIGFFNSTNHDVAIRETSARQWFVIDVYRTESGRYAAHVQYRTGSKLGREHPIDRLYVAETIDALHAILRDVSTSTDFVTGWPGGGAPESNRGRDFTSHHESVCNYADAEYCDVLGKFANSLIGPEPAEVIL